MGDEGAFVDGGQVTLTVEGHGFEDVKGAEDDTCNGKGIGCDDTVLEAKIVEPVHLSFSLRRSRSHGQADELGNDDVG